MAEPLLSLDGVYAGYGATEILRGVDFVVKRQRQSWREVSSMCRRAAGFFLT